MADPLNPYQFPGNVHVLNCIFTKGHLQITMMPSVKSKINFPFAKGLSKKKNILQSKKNLYKYITFTLQLMKRSNHLTTHL